MSTQLQMPMSNLQQEILKIYSHNLPEEQLLEIKNLLAQYFANKAIDEADKIWDEKGYTNELMDEWLNKKKSSNED